MFSVCSSIEYDFRNFIAENIPTVILDKELVDKAYERNKEVDREWSRSDNIELLNGLDLGDYYGIVMSNNAIFKVNEQRKSKLSKIFDKIIPIRNRVMHSRPIEFADRSILEEALNSIDREIPTINWKETKNTRKIILEEPQSLLLNTKMNSVIDDSTKVFHNLPLPEFDDTGFIGRKQEISDIVKLVVDNKNQIISIVGNGGIGKTATAVKCLYDVIDNPLTEDRFEAIIWTSLKTRALTKGEFENIKNSISSVEGMYSNIRSNMVLQSEDPIDDIINFMGEFKTLLVIDNLETVATSEVIKFLKDIPESSKVLITSRSGIGELENRYKLSEMKPVDSRAYFRLLSQYYGLNAHERDNKEIDRLIKDNLYSSPLSIKWFITSLYSGVDEKTILSNKTDLITFCMSNIIDRLDIHQKNILSLLLLEGKPLGFGEIDYYLDRQTDDIVKDISILLSTSMIDLKNIKYQINNMTKDYLSIHNPPPNDFIQKITRKRTDLNGILQEVKIKKESDPFKPKSLFGNMEDDNKKIASFYLIQALDKSFNELWDDSLKLVERAMSVAPEYFEVYKIKAYINAENNNLFEAINSYRTAIENARNGIEKASVYYLFSRFYKLKMNDFEEAKKMIDMADTNYPNDSSILLEKSRVQVFLGQYDEAEKTLLLINPSEESTEKFKNQYASRYADICVRKSQTYEKRDFEKRFELIKKAITLIEDVNDIDRGTSAILIKVLNELSNLTYEEKAKKLFEEKIKQHFNIIVGNTNNIVRKLKNNIEGRSGVLNAETIEFGKRFAINYFSEAQSITEKNNGIVVKLLENAGFVNNSYGSYYFRKDDVSYEDIKVGDQVNFVLVKSTRGLNAKNLKLNK